MRFVLYNIRYATGTGPAFHLPVPGAGYLRSNSRVLERITQYLKSLDPDLVGRAPNMPAYRGLESLTVYLEARRELLFDRFA